MPTSAPPPAITWPALAGSPAASPRPPTFSTAPTPSASPRPPWRPPVPGGVLRRFSYGADPFARGWHRGVDLRAAPGATVRAACGGRVVTALPGAVVTLRCGPWRVTHLPMAAVSVRVGRRVAPGTRIGTLGTSRTHQGLHLGVRRAGDPFGYVDPLPFLRFRRPPGSAPPLFAAPRRAPPPASSPRLVRPLRAPPPAQSPRLVRPLPAPPPVSSPRLVRPLPAPPPVSTPRLVRPLRAPPPVSSPRLVRPLRAPPPVSPPRLVRPRLAPLSARRPVGVRVPPSSGLAPWPVWAGLALVLFGACGGGVRWRLRARRVGVPGQAREAVR